MTRTLAVLLRLKPACMVLAFEILGMRSGIADGVLALGSAKGGPTFGWAAGFSKAGADGALNECRGKYKCEVVATFHDQCFAISSNGTSTKWTSPSVLAWRLKRIRPRQRRRPLVNASPWRGKERRRAWSESPIARAQRNSDQSSAPHLW
jgi:hypothetical protein